MIAVIADDLTGAAEMSGICLRNGRKTFLAMNSVIHTASDVLVACTDSRSLRHKEAMHVTEMVTLKMKELKPEQYFKKIDSVLRGYVIDEIRLQMKLLGYQRTLMLPANPTLGRIIKNGKYYIHDQLIHTTSFSRDAEFPILDSDIFHMLRINTPPDVKLLSVGDPIPTQGIFIGEVSSWEDLLYWIQKIESDMFLAGAGDFLEALLSTKSKAAGFGTAALQMPHLYVGGTSYGKSVAFIYELYKKEGPVFYIPTSHLNHPNEKIPFWIDQVVKTLQDKQHAIIAIDPRIEIPSFVTPASLRKITAALVKQVMQKIELAELFIEGGSTASSILHELGYLHLEPIMELRRGVVKLKPTENNHLLITVKPGSYDLPQDVLALYSNL